ncbi:cobalamin-5'-phosphate synthase [Chitinophaga skermanii]|uniref:Adenosylcobinamide-GDP ribazoletransferase n=1 Tax=Chitinophaga skermanii TaxID=331697 RepID=A0A327R105_9BACT|nr:adenosylcobinamide-GDP ribazoletransferase [Chitinophaga skermanii]RAJ10539.1 cobalamin-5'-phosphate synthase [Chitinophaga skermanii]
MKKEWHYFLTAVMFYTRIRVPKNIGHSEDMLNKATRYFPLIGWVIGGIVAGSLYLTSLILPFEVAVILALVAGIWATGAFHEDGFADMCDGFGGGWTKERILDIMKDSRIGTYGMLGLVLVMLIKFYCLSSMTLYTAITAILVAHPLSRWIALNVVYNLHYVRENEDSKAKPIAKGMETLDFIFATLTAIFPLAAFIITQYLPWQYLLMFIPLILVYAYFVKLMKRWIGGYTGDCLGALQQAAETTIYIFICAVWKFI